LGTAAFFEFLVSVPLPPTLPSEFFLVVLQEMLISAPPLLGHLQVNRLEKSAEEWRQSLQLQGKMTQLLINLMAAF